jgi:hypothetical protein
MRESVFDLLSRLEALLQRGAAVPLTDKKVVDEREALAVLEMIRAVLPAELREAQLQAHEAERLLRAAQDDARRIVLEAQATARRLVEEHALIDEATRRTEDILARAERDALAVRDGADAYAAGVLAELEQSVTRVLDAIRRGRELLKGPGGSAYNEQSGQRG